MPRRTLALALLYLVLTSFTGSPSESGFATTYARLKRSLAWFGTDFDLLAGRLQALRADLEIDAGLVDGLERVLERQVAILQNLELLIQLLQRLLVGQLIVHGSTFSTRAPRCPVASRMRSLRSTAVSAVERTTCPVSASIVML